MRAGILLVALGACTPPSAEPGQLVASNVYNDLGRQLTVAGEHLFWAIQTTVHAGKTEVFCGDLASIPVSDLSIGIVDTVFATAGDQVLVSSAKAIGLLACDGTFTHIATAARPVQSLAYDAPTGDVAWGMASDQGFPATVGWLHGGALHSVDVPSALGVGDLVFAGSSLFMSVGGTQDGYLSRLDVSTGTLTQLATASEQQSRFPPQGLDRGPARFSAGALIADEPGLLWSVQRTDDLAGDDRSILIELPGGNLPSNALVTNLWGTTRAWSHGGALYWVEPTSDPDLHFPSPYFHAAIWTAPRTGGDASYFHSSWERPDIQLEQFTSDYVLGFYGGGDPSHLDIRRVPLAEFVAAPPPPRDCSATPCE